jgi:tetratricopeptide (TPR) repeat protein
MSDYDHTLENLGHALENLDEAVRLIPSDANALNNRCGVYALKGNPEKGLDDCEKAVHLRPNDPHLLDSLALTYFQMSRFENDNSKKDEELLSAIKYYDAALSFSPTLASSRYGRGLAKRETGDIQGGNADILAAKEIDKTVQDEFEKGLRPHSSN